MNRTARDTFRGTLAIVAATVSTLALTPTGAHAATVNFGGDGTSPARGSGKSRIELVEVGGRDTSATSAVESKSLDARSKH